MQAERRELPVLNGIRGLAVAIVFASHASNIYFAGAITGWGGGQLGVMLFFLLSGFLMSHLYLHRIPDIQQVTRFIVNRIARIYPMFALVVLLCFVISSHQSLFYVYPVTSFAEVVRHLLFIHGYEVLWTIGPEVIFYGVFLCLWRIRATNNREVFFGCIIVGMLLSWLPLDVFGGNSLMQLHDRMPYFLIGVLLGAGSNQLIHRDKLPGIRGEWMFWLVLTIYLCSFPQVVKLTGLAPRLLIGDPWPDPWAYPFYLTITALLLMVALLTNPRLLTHRAAQHLGKISFSFYLLHFIVLKNVQSFLVSNPWLGIAAALLLTISVSTLSFHLIERPARRVIRSASSLVPAGDSGMRPT
jgi:peptidoglycan/LPS O-acetylase OafA/YrhL